MRLDEIRDRLFSLMNRQVFSFLFNQTELLEMRQSLAVAEEHVFLISCILDKSYQYSRGSSSSEQPDFTEEEDSIRARENHEHGSSPSPEREDELLNSVPRNESTLFSFVDSWSKMTQKLEILGEGAVWEALGAGYKENGESYWYCKLARQWIRNRYGPDTLLAVLC